MVKEYASLSSDELTNTEIHRQSNIKRDLIETPCIASAHPEWQTMPHGEYQKFTHASLRKILVTLLNSIPGLRITQEEKKQLKRQLLPTENQER